MAIEDIVRELRELAKTLYNKERVEGCEIVDVWSGCKHFAARIEAAANGLRTENEMLKDEIKCKTQNYEDVIRAKDQELTRLRAALKPVLELAGNCSGYWLFATLAVDAVLEAQKIYKEVTK